MLKVGKLYRCEEYHLLFYPDPETAAGASAAPRSAVEGGGNVGARYWSKRFGKPVSYAHKNIPLLVLNSKENLYEVLAGDKKGWIIYCDWLKIKEIDYA